MAWVTENQDKADAALNCGGNRRHRLLDFIRPCILTFLLFELRLKVRQCLRFVVGEKTRGYDMILPDCIERHCVIQNPWKC
jgi:hypothetical protein